MSLSGQTLPKFQQIMLQQAPEQSMIDFFRKRFWDLFEYMYICLTQDSAFPIIPAQN